MTDFSADKLREMIAKATDEDLTDEGRYFDETFNDLTKCGHGDTGEYQNRHDGKLVELLWNNRGAILAMAEERERMREESLSLAREISELRSDLAVMREHDCSEVKRMREALKPFARHVGKRGEKITLSWGADTWTGTLTPEHFYAASDCIHAVRKEPKP